MTQQIISYESRIEIPQLAGGPRVERERHLTRQAALDHVKAETEGKPDKTQAYVVEVKERCLVAFKVERITTSILKKKSPLPRAIKQAS